MKLQEPFLISSRLLPAIKVGDVFISIEPREYNRRGRLCWSIYFDGNHEGQVIEVEEDGLQSGMGDQSYYTTFSSLLAFLSAWVEAIRYSTNGKESDNLGLFDKRLANWATHYSDEISLLSYELDEGVYRDCLQEDVE